MKMISLMILVSLIASGCSSHKRYSVTFKNYSDDQIYVERGIWGEWVVRGGYINGFSKEHIFPPGRTHAGLPGPIPQSIGVLWKNSNNQVMEEYVDINKDDVPKVLRGEWHQFVITLSQSKIHQVEVVVHVSGNVRQKKKKSMLYCSEGESNCEFMTPFTTDSYYDPEKLTDAQKEKLERQAEIMENFESELKKDLDEKGIEHKFSNE